MFQSRGIRICVLLMFLTCPRTLLCGQSALDLLAKSISLVDIRAEGSPAFHLRATVQFHENPPSQGRYDLKWRSPSSWREEIEAGNLRQVRIANADRLWEQRNLPYFTPEVEDLEKVMEFPKHIEVLGDERVGVVQEKEVNRIRSLCFEVKKGHLIIKRVCLERDSYFPVQVDYSPQNGGGGFQYEGTVTFDKYKFPRVMRDFDKNPVLEFRVEELTGMSSGDSDSFVVPPDARSHLWCPNPTQAEPVEEGALIPNEIAPRLRGERAIIYGVIGADGRWRDLAIVQSSGRVSSSNWFSFVQSFHFRPARCGGIPIETDRLMKFGRN